MSKRSERLASPAVDAMDRVLDAEARARRSIEAAEAEAESAVEAARARARRIRRRTTQRIVDLHRSQIDKTQALIEQMRREARSLGITTDLDAEDRAALERAASALARELTGGGP